MYSASKLTSVGSFVTSIASFLLAICLGSWSWAATAIVDTNGFESPGFNVGILEGQSDWLRAGAVGGNATVQNTNVKDGAFALQLDRGANVNNRWAAPVGGEGFPKGRYITIGWDMNVTATGAPAGVFGPFLGVDTYDATISPKVLGSLGVDATTGEVLYQLGGSGVLAVTNASVVFGQWHHFQIQLDFFEDKYTVFFDGTSLASTSFVDVATETFTDADIAAFAASFDTASRNQIGTAFIDNFLVSDIDRADFDVDRDVDATDLATWQTAFGSTSGGDTDGDSNTDGADFLTWQREHDGGAAPLAGPVSVVPEPSTLTLALLMLGLFSRRR